MASAPDAGSEGGAPPGRDVPALEVLAGRGPTDMPMMRETTRVAEAATKPTELETKTADTCYRAALAASLPVRAWFEDDKRARRGDEARIAGPVINRTGATGLVPPRGPACARKGETLRLVVEASEGVPVARAVIWQAP